MNKTVVAIHGIGEQTQYATIQSVVSQFCGYYDVGMSVPLGRFHASTLGPVIQMAPPGDSDLMKDLAFAEVYWAGVPREVAKDGFQLEETKAWGRTITNRLARRAEAAPNSAGALPRREQVRLVTVVDEMVETIKILERVTFLASQAGLFKFNLGNLLRDYVGDVQIVADFPERRDKILQMFDGVMTKVTAPGGPGAGNAELYVVAHSEGTVVTFMAILHALADPAKYPWIAKIRGLMTIGSPIETHHLFWPELWQQDPSLRPSAKAPIDIPWKNYLDTGDPIAYPLAQTRTWLNESRFAKNLVLEEMEFSRSFLPGKAHTDYWQDEQVFGHFIDTVIVNSGSPKRPRPANSFWARVVSYAVPQLLIAALLILATYVLYKPVVKALDYNQGRTVMFADVIGITALLLGVTVGSRIPRFTRLWRWWMYGAVMLLACFAAYAYLVSDAVRHAIGSAYGGVNWPLTIRDAETTGVLVAATVLTTAAVFFASWFPRWGVRLLPALGLASATVLVIQLLVQAQTKADVWPIVIGGALFFYLWWLAALVFDLVFVWHRFVRHGVATETVAELVTKGYQPTKVENRVLRFGRRKEKRS